MVSLGGSFDEEERSEFGQFDAGDLVIQILVAGLKTHLDKLALMMWPS
jgi:hypothetical protein